MSLHSKVALVTGSSRGIGEACVRLLASRGASVIINYVNSASVAEKLAKELEEKHKDIKAAAIKALAAASLKLFDHVDILVHNAGVMDPKNGGWEASDDVYDFMMRTNVRGRHKLNRALIPHMPSGSSIIYFSSGLTKATAPPPTYLVYNMSKGAVEQAVRVLCKALGPKGIRVKACGPGPTATELFLAPETQQEIDAYAKMAALGRLGTPEDIAKVVAFLASEESGWVNGQTLHTNGGFAV